MRPILVAVALIAAAACSSGRVVERSGHDRESEPTPLWKLDPDEPYPFTTPIPPLEATPADGSYGRSVTVRFAGGRPVNCRRCAPYRIEAGETSLRLERGRFYVAHAARGELKSADFRSSGHFLLEDDEIVFFNDVNCPETRGRYGWSLDGSELEFDVIDDPCAAGLRSRFLPALAWELL